MVMMVMVVMVDMVDMVDKRDGWDRWDRWDSQLFSGIRVDRGGKMSKKEEKKKLWQR